MVRILTIDDSRAVRTIITKTLGDQFEILEAEDGEKGLELLAKETVNLILLDLTMPVMDGQEMLQKLRDQGNETPVILLTSESRTSLVSTMMQIGISDYILKPFKPEELIDKLAKVLGADMPETESDEAGEDGKKSVSHDKVFVDILLIDDMENVARKFNLLMPEHIDVRSTIDAHSSLEECRERVFKTIIIDMVIPNVNSAALTSQLRVLQPTAAFIALYMRNYENPAKDSREQGFDSYMVKPFDPAQINEFLSTYYDAEDLLILEDNVLSVTAFPDSKARRAQSVTRVITLTNEAIDTVAAACYEDVIMDLSTPPPTETLPKILIAAKRRTVEVGLNFRVVGSDTVTKALSSLADTAGIPVYGTLKEALETAG